MNPEILFSVMAPSGSGQGPGLMVFMFQMFAFIAIIYFLMIRPKIQQEKKHRQRLEDLKRGDEVITAGGVMGTVVHLKDKQVTIKTGDTRLIVHRDRIADIEAPGAGESEKK